MFDVGIGELAVLAVLALIVFGPDRLPQVTAQATHLLRQLREQAASARADLAESVDLDSTGLKDLADLHPKRIAASVLAPVEDVRRQVVDAVGAAGSDAATPSGSTPPVASSPRTTPPSALFDPDAT